MTKIFLKKLIACPITVVIGVLKFNILVHGIIVFSLNKIQKYSTIRFFQ